MGLELPLPHSEALPVRLALAVSVVERLKLGDPEAVPEGERLRLPQAVGVSVGV